MKRFNVLLAVAITCTCEGIAEAPKKPFDFTPDEILVVGYHARSVSLRTISGSLGFWAGPVATMVQNKVTHGSRVPLAEALNANFPDFRAEVLVANEMVKYLQSLERFQKTSVSRYTGEVNLPGTDDLRTKQPNAFMPDTKDVVGWCKAGQRWQRAAPQFPYLTADQSSMRGLVCAEFAIEHVELNQGRTLKFIISFRFIRPGTGHVLDRYVSDLSANYEIPSIERKEGAECFEASFTKAAAGLAKACVDRALGIND